MSRHLNRSKRFKQIKTNIKGSRHSLFQKKSLKWKRFDKRVNCFWQSNSLELSKVRSRYKTKNLYKDLLLKKKQVSFFYGGLTLTKLDSFVAQAANNPQNLFILLETMLFMVVFRLGFCISPYMAKYLIQKGCILVNGKVILYSYYRVRLDDIISVDSKLWYSLFFKSISLFQSKKFMNIDKTNKGLTFSIPTIFYRLPPKHFEFNFKLLTGVMIAKPSMQNTTFPVNLDFASLL